MQRAVATTVALTAIVIVSACSSTTIQTDHDHEADFSAYSTFAWRSGFDEEQYPTAGPSQIVDRRIRRAISGDMTSKGFTTASPDTADLLVTYYVSLDQQLRMYSTGWGYGWGYGPRWGYGYGFWPGWGYTTVSTYHEGSIIVDIVDREKKQLVWRGVVTRVLGKKSSSEEKIDQSMGRLMSDFPPT